MRAHVAYGLALRHISSICAGVSPMGCSIASLVSWISMERSMDELEELKECSPHLGDISLSHDCKNIAEKPNRHALDLHAAMW